MLRWLTAGESHGPSLTAILEGLPAHVALTTDDLADALARRRLGYGRGARMKFEQDAVTITGGVRHGRTRKSLLPFGPWLVTGALLGVLAGADVAAWYAGTLTGS